MAKTNKLAGKSKGVPSPKKQAVKEENNFQKDFERLGKELLKPEYQNREFVEGSTVEISSRLLVQIINEWHSMATFMTQMKNLLQGAGQQTETVVNKSDILTFNLMLEYKKAVDSGITIEAKAKEKTKDEIFSERVNLLGSVGFIRSGEEFLRADIKLTSEEIFNMTDEAFSLIFEVKTEAV